MQGAEEPIDTDRGRWNAAVAVGDEKTGPREERYAEYSIILAGETDAVSFELRATTRYTSFKLLHRAAKLSLGAAVRPLSVVRYGDCLRNRLRVAFQGSRAIGMMRMASSGAALGGGGADESRWRPTDVAGHRHHVQALRAR